MDVVRRFSLILSVTRIIPIWMGGEDIIIVEKLDILIFNEFCYKKNMFNTLSKNDWEKGELFRGGGGGDDLILPCKNRGIYSGGGGDLFRGDLIRFPNFPHK